MRKLIYITILLSLMTLSAWGEIKEAHLHKIDPYTKSYFCEVNKKEYWADEECRKDKWDNDLCINDDLLLSEKIKSLETRIKELEEKSEIHNQVLKKTAVCPYCGYSGGCAHRKWE